METISRDLIARTIRKERTYRLSAHWLSPMPGGRKPGRLYTNAECRDRVLSDFFSHNTDLGCYPIEYVTHDGDILCADCAKTAVLDDREVVTSDIYYEGPTEYCAGCNREIESAYGDPDAEPEELPGSDRWHLADDGTLDTVLACNVCGYEERFSDRAAAALFIEDDEECYECAEKLAAR